MTFDFHENEYRMSDHLTDRALEIARRLAPARADALRRRGPYDPFRLLVGCPASPVPA